MHKHCTLLLYCYFNTVCQTSEINFVIVGAIQYDRCVPSIVLYENGGTCGSLSTAQTKAAKWDILDEAVNSLSTRQDKTFFISVWSSVIS